MIFTSKQFESESFYHMAEKEYETICIQHWDCVPEKKTVCYFYTGQQVSIPQSEEAAQQPDTVRKSEAGTGSICILDVSL